MKHKSILIIFIAILLLWIVQANAQITAPGSSATIQTEYPSFTETDSIFIFCTTGAGTPAAALQAQTSLTGTKTFSWEKYNPATGAFDFYFSESTEGMQSLINGLESGGYRVTISQGTTTEIYRGWVFNQSLTAEASDSIIDCDAFLLKGNFTSAAMNYYDPSTNATLEVAQDIRVEWLQDQTIVGSALEQTVYYPPAADTEYTLRVYDRFGCEALSSVVHESIVPKAQFSIDLGEQQNNNQLEAPLTVSFINESENGDPGLYEWFFYRDLEELKQESENNQQPVDSIMVVAYDDNPTFTYEDIGTYMVKLVAKHVSEFHTCVDTFYMPEYIIIEPSFIEAPNVFTPNGDGINDEFIILFRSMQSINIQIFNRWGKRIHLYENNDVRGYEDAFAEAIWDGKVGGRYASPGVYYYVVEGRGRDDEIRRANGYFHLFRGKE